jgi:hypothetical protein
MKQLRVTAEVTGEWDNLPGHDIYIPLSQSHEMGNPEHRDSSVHAANLNMRL